MFDISFNMSKLMGEIDHLINGLPQAVNEALTECGQAVIAEEVSRTKGKLAQSFYTYKEGDTQVIDNKKDYAQYVEKGRGPITAVSAKALRFVINGEVLFRKSVGPMKAQPFVKDSLNSAKSNFVNIFEKHINKLIKS